MPPVMPRKMRTPPRLLLRLAIIAASVVTLLFGLSTMFIFGAATHKRASLGWTSASANADLVQAICHHGQFHLAIEFSVVPGRTRSAEPRGWHAGAHYSPSLDLDVRVSERVTSRYGADGYWDSNGPRFYAGVFGLYPTLLLWALVWFIARRKGQTVGRCSACGYDLRASPNRCPECGELPAGHGAAA